MYPPINCEYIRLDLSRSSMSFKHRRDVSFSLATFFLRVVGFWLTSSPLEEWLGNATVMYSVITIVFSMWVQTRGLYFSWGDFGVSSVMKELNYSLSILFLRKYKFEIIINMISLFLMIKMNWWLFLFQINNFSNFGLDFRCALSSRAIVWD